MRAFVVGVCFSYVILSPPSPPGVIGDDDVLCMALIGTGETLCSTDTPADRLLPTFRSIAAVRNRLLCDCGSGGWCCCELALVMMEGEDLIEGECRSRIEWAAFWIT